jgi:high-affinity Fe2+/Pb2+ permease
MSMDSSIEKIIAIIKSVPQDALLDDETLRTILVQAGKESAKSFTDEEINQHLQQLKELMQETSSANLIAKLLQIGGSRFDKSQLDDINSRLNE